MSLGRVVALGAHILDVLGRPVESIPSGQGSARLAEIRATPAGTAAGTAVDLARLGAEVYAVGAVGDDLLADLLEAAMRGHGVDTGGLVRVPGTQTSATILPIRPNGERPALHVPGAMPLLRLEDIDLAGVASAQVLLVGAPDALGWLTEHGLADVVAAAKAGGALVVVDVLRPGSPRDLGRLRGVLAEADWFLPNGEQICALTGRTDPVQAIDDVLALGTAGVAVTLGAAGALVATRGGGAPARVPAIDVAVVDTTGCGDAFNAGMIAGLLQGASPVDAAWLGVACGALAATGLGSDAGITDLHQVLAFLRDSAARVGEGAAMPAAEGAGTASAAADRLAALADSETGAGAGQRAAQANPVELGRRLEPGAAATTSHPPRAADRALRERALAVIPGGMYGHQAVGQLPAEYPQFMRSGSGARVWDVDGNEYIDLMCGYGPVVLGHQHHAVEAAARAQAALADCQNGPGQVMVELAELLVATVRHGDWAMFAKNGTDATTICCTIARAATGRAKILVARGAYHGALPWCTPRLAGTTPADRANLGYYEYNDLESARAAAAEAGSDLAAVLVSPFRHDAGFDQELVDPAFARGLRELCDLAGAALILDDVRCGFRLHLGGSWEPIGVDPDLSAWSKAIANGHPLAAVLGSERFRRAAGEVFVTGSFWFSAVPMAAAIATIRALRDEDAITTMERAGLALREGIVDQAAAHGLEVHYTGPPQMPYLSFVGDRGYEMASVFAAEAVRRGAFVHPRHNWFVSAAMTGDDVAAALAATDAAFAAVRRTGAERDTHLAHH
jgi:glutamate-1-semialdehyde 2,1-aminomutase